jgi:hypothetical protein
MVINSQPSAPSSRSSSPPNQKHLKLNGDKSLLNIIKYEIQELFSITLHDTMNDVAINIELLDIYDKFKYIKKLSYISKFNKNGKEPLMIFPLCDVTEDCYLYGKNYDDPRLKGKLIHSLTHSLTH